MGAEQSTERRAELDEKLVKTAQALDQEIEPDETLETADTTDGGSDKENHMYGSRSRRSRDKSSSRLSPQYVDDAPAHEEGKSMSSSRRSKRSSRGERGDRDRDRDRGDREDRDRDRDRRSSRGRGKEDEERGSSSRRERGEPRESGGRRDGSPLHEEEFPAGRAMGTKSPGTESAASHKIADESVPAPMPMADLMAYLQVVANNSSNLPLTRRDDPELGRTVSSLTSEEYAFKCAAFVPSNVRIIGGQFGRYGRVWDLPTSEVSCLPWPSCCCDISCVSILFARC